MRLIQTTSDSHLQRHRDHHVSHPEFGTHRHPYLHDTMRQLAASLSGNEAPSLLDYGCGKGVFLREMARLTLFRYIRGYDPAMPAFQARPAQTYDMVTCLDVLDQLEDGYVEPAIRDVAQFTGRFAVFSLITRQSAEFEHLHPRSGPAWREIVERHLAVSDMTIRPSTPEEIAQGASLERVILTAEPRATSDGG